jgi:hypothetical protein
VSWSLPLSLFLEPCSALLWPPLVFFLHWALLHQWLKIYSLPSSSLDCLPGDQQEAPWVPSTPAGDQVLSLPPGKLDGPAWNSGLSSFLSKSFSALLMVDVSIGAISCIVASMAKTLKGS